MFRALVFSAVAAGCIAGMAVSVFQWAIVTPLILEAEIFEHGAATARHGAAVLNIGRTLLTSLATMLYASGLALVLLGAMLLTGSKINSRSALCWGVAGFFAVALAPALGLPPVVPGVPEAPLMERQIWWLGTVLATAFGLWAMLRLKTPVWLAVGTIAIVAPHVIGAPHLDAAATDVPAALAAHFVSASLVASVLLWASVSAASGFAFERLAAEQQ